MGKVSKMIMVLVVLCLVGEALCKSKKPQKQESAEFDFYYFVQQWPGAYCDNAKRKNCCFPDTGKLNADFSIHGLWPNYNDGVYPSNCDSSNRFDESQVEELESRLETEWPSLECPSIGPKFWAHVWNKHGTCSSFSTQLDYFQASLDLKEKTNLLQALKDADIVPNDKFYNVEDMKEAIKEKIGFYPWIECNRDSKGNRQLYQVYVCVDANGQDLIECLVLPRGNCGSRIQFPKF